MHEPNKKKQICIATRLNIGIIGFIVSPNGGTFIPPARVRLYKTQ